MNKNQTINYKATLLFLIYFLFTTSLFSQSSVDYKWYANVNGGITQGFGDIEDEANLTGKINNETDIGYGLRFGRYISPVFAIHAQLLKANIIGQKTSNDLKYNSDLLETQLGFTVNVLNIFSDNKRSRRINIYATSGIGMVFFNTRVHQLSSGMPINDIGDTDSKETAFIVPVGAGLDVKLTDKWYINLESVLRFTDTDKLDVVEGGSQNDAYLYSSLGLTYHFGSKGKTSNQVPVEDIAEAQTPIPDYFVNVEYFLPEDIVSGEEFEMKCLITKGSIDGKAELTQVLPIGFIVKDTKIGGARTEFQNYTLHLYWDEIPVDSVFEISYMVMPEKVYGVFPYTSILYLGKTGKEYKFKSSVVVKKEIATEEIVQQELDKTEELPASKPTITEVAPVGAISKTEFRVQVRASKQAIIPITKLAKKYNLIEKINEDYSGNWYRYSIGSFSTYNDAKTFRNTLISENGISDAFVVVFYNGERLDNINDLKDIDPNNYPGQKSITDKSVKMYGVQIFAVFNNSIDIETIKETYNINQDINEEVYQSWRRYIIGRFTTFKEANNLKDTLAEKGIADAFVVIYQDGKRTDINN